MGRAAGVRPGVGPGRAESFHKEEWEPEAQGRAAKRAGPGWVASGVQGPGWTGGWTGRTDGQEGGRASEWERWA